MELGTVISNIMFNSQFVSEERYARDMNMVILLNFVHDLPVLKHVRTFPDIN